LIAKGKGSSNTDHDRDEIRNDWTQLAGLSFEAAILLFVDNRVLLKTIRQEHGSAV
jgi:hypothetical protein